MKLLKIIGAFIVILVSIFVISYLKYDTETFSFSIDQEKENYISSVNVDLNNAEVSLYVTQSDMIFVDVMTNDMDAKNKKIYVHEKDDTLNIKENIFNPNQLIKTQSKVKVYIPQSITIDKVNINLNNSVVKINQIKSDSISINGKYIDSRIDKVTAKDLKIDVNEGNNIFIDSYITSLDVELNKGVVDLTRNFMDNVSLNYFENGYTNILDSKVNKFVIAGIGKVDVSIAAKDNYNFYTDEVIDNPNLVSKENGYEYIGSPSIEVLYEMFLGDSILGEFNIE